MESKNAIDEEDNKIEERIDEIALSKFGIKELRVLQREVILRIIRAENEERQTRQTVIMPTGAGKSLCFMIPSSIIKGATLIVYPLISLMKDQKRRLDEAGVKSAVLSGSKSAEEIEREFLSIKNGAKIIISNPEILQSKKIRSRLKDFAISHIVIDEAHCVCEWGESFRPSYLLLGEVIKEINPVCVSSFTATASSSVLQSIREHLFGSKDSGDVIRGAGDRPNIRYSVIPALSKIREVKELCKNCKKPALIFCGTRGKSEECAKTLSDFFGLDSEKIRFYHAGMTKDEKLFTEDWFFNSSDGILCATCAYGMGVDKKNIRTVIHLEPSPTLESYMQEAGRGGRDGEDCEAIMLFSYTDFAFRQGLKEGDRRKKILEYALLSSCRRNFLLLEMGEEKCVECYGCDICCKTAVKEAQDMLYIQKIVRKKNRWFTQKSLASALIAQNWAVDEAQDAIFQMILAHKIKKCGFLFKNRIRV